MAKVEVSLRGGRYLWKDYLIKGKEVLYVPKRNQRPDIDPIVCILDNTLNVKVMWGINVIGVGIL